MNFILSTLWVILGGVIGYHLSKFMTLPDGVTPILSACGCATLALLFRFFPAIVAEALT